MVEMVQITIWNECKKGTVPSHGHSLKTFVVHTLFWHKIWHFSSVSADTLYVHFVQSSLLFKTVQTFNAYPYSTVVYLKIYYPYWDIYPQVMAILSLSHTHTHFLSWRQLETKDNCTAFNFFFERMHNTFHLITFIQLLNLLNIMLFTNWSKKSKSAEKRLSFSVNVIHLVIKNLSPENLKTIYNEKPSLPLVSDLINTRQRGITCIVQWFAWQTEDQWGLNNICRNFGWD